MLLLLCYYLSCHYFRPVSYMLLCITCISLDIDVLSPDHHTCYYLARPSFHVMTYPDYYQSLVMFDCLLNIIILSCYHLTPSMIYLTLWLSCLREFCLVILNGTKCHTEQSATSHTWWGPPLESVGATSRIYPLRTKCHMEQSATHTRWGPPLESVGATSWICRAISCHDLLFP